MGIAASSFIQTLVCLGDRALRLLTEYVGVLGKESLLLLQRRLLDREEHSCFPPSWLTAICSLLVVRLRWRVVGATALLPCCWELACLESVKELLLVAGVRAWGRAGRLQ